MSFFTRHFGAFWEKFHPEVYRFLGLSCRLIGGFLNGRDVFLTLPTGSGKSVRYVALPLLFDSLWHQEGHIVLVVSPLIALMQDQVSSRTLTRTRSHKYKMCHCECIPEL